MNNKGFTLIELLSVVILLSIIVFLVMPNVVNLLKDKEKDIDELTFTIIKDATKLYMEDNNEFYDKKNGNQYCITLSELVDSNYLKNNIKYDGDDITNLMSIQVNYNSGYNYELVRNSECIESFENCTLISGEENVVGSKYECEVKRGIFYNFYVLSNNSDGTSNLIMDRNICEDGTLATSEKTCLIAYNSSGESAKVGPVTAISYLNNATRTWNKIRDLNILYEDEGKNFTGFELTGKARLPYKSEVANSNGDNNYLYENLDSAWSGIGEKPINNINKIYGYWLLSSYEGISSQAWRIHFSGVIGASDVNVNVGFGVRPVIKVKL